MPVMSMTRASSIGPGGYGQSSPTWLNDGGPQSSILPSAFMPFASRLPPSSKVGDCETVVRIASSDWARCANDGLLGLPRTRCQRQRFEP
jgi:hypothetical protein